MTIAGPKCPNQECNVVGVEYITTAPVNTQGTKDDPWIDVAFCAECGHVYGVFAKEIATLPQGQLLVRALSLSGSR